MSNTKNIPVLSDEQKWLARLKAGDPVSRMIAGTVFMELEVTRIANGRILCGLWEFDLATGAEIDEELGWDANSTGSYIRPKAN